METLGSELPRQISRVRDEVLPAYVEIGDAGFMAASMMRRDLDLASKAMIAGDVIEMLRVYELLKGYST